MSNHGQGHFDPNQPQPGQAGFPQYYDPQVMTSNPGHYPYAQNTNTQYYLPGSGSGIQGVNGGDQEYGMMPAYPTFQGGSQAYGSAPTNASFGHAPWQMQSTTAPLGPSDMGTYHYTDPSNGALSWHGASPPVRYSTPQPGSNRIPQHPNSIQQVVLPEQGRTQASGSAKKYVCPFCPSEHSRKADVERHVRSIHTNELRYPCLGCGDAFVRTDKRISHWKESPACKPLHLQRGGT